VTEDQHFELDVGEADSGSAGGGRRGLFWATIAAVILTDVATKAAAVASLMLGVPRDLFGQGVRLALVYNPGAAFGLNFGPSSRQIFVTLTIGALVALVMLYRKSPPGDGIRMVAIGLVAGGAIGNLLDRLRSPAGVVDFIDVGIGSRRWPTFNVADMAVTTGACLLAYVLWLDDRARESRGAPVPEM
jgi:signal peptidase II